MVVFWEWDYFPPSLASLEINSCVFRGRVVGARRSIYFGYEKDEEVSE